LFSLSKERVEEAERKRQIIELGRRLENLRSYFGCGGREREEEYWKQWKQTKAQLDELEKRGTAPSLDFLSLRFLKKRVTKGERLINYLIAAYYLSAIYQKQTTLQGERWSPVTRHPLFSSSSIFRRLTSATPMPIYLFFHR
jgi:hypothetical protein